MIPTNITNHNFLTHKILSNVECLVLLHSPIIINVEKLRTTNKEVYDDKIDDDFTTQKINDYFSSSDFVSGCILRRNKIHPLGYMKLNSLDCTKKWWIDELSFGLCIEQSD
jgi:hypothetical protein